MNHSSSAGRRLVEALYDFESGRTFVRHPEREGEWLQSDLLDAVLKGRPVSSMSGRDECEVFSTIPHGHNRTAPQTSTLLLTTKGHHSELD